jgi:hypothetical protein
MLANLKETNDAMLRLKIRITSQMATTTFIVFEIW